MAQSSTLSDIERSQVRRGSKWTLLCKIGTVVVTLACNTAFARLLGPQDFGVLFLSFSALTILSVIFLFGLHFASVRYVPKLTAEGRENAAKGVLVTALLILLAVSAVLAFIGPVIFREVFEFAKVTENVDSLSTWMTVNLIALMLVMFLAEGYRSLKAFGPALALTGGMFGNLSTNSVTLAGTLLVASFAEEVSLVDIVRVMSISTGGVGLIALAFFLGFLRQAKVERADIRPLLVTGMEICVVYLVTVTALTQFPVWLIGWISTNDVVGQYGAALRLAVIVNAPIVFAQGIVPPFVSELYTKREYARLTRTLRSIATVTGLMSIAAALFFIVFGRSVLGYLYGPEFVAAYPFLLLLAITWMLNVCFGQNSILLMMSGFSRHMMIAGLALLPVGVAVGLSLGLLVGPLGVVIAKGLLILGQNSIALWLAITRAKIATQMYFRPGEIVRAAREISAWYLEKKKPAPAPKPKSGAGDELGGKSGQVVPAPSE